MLKSCRNIFNSLILVWVIPPQFHEANGINLDRLNGKCGLEKAEYCDYLWE